MIIINGRFLLARQTGVQRFANEIIKELLKIRNDIVVVTPKTEQKFEYPTISFGNTKGHIWEQTELPLFLARKGNPVLLNLASTAPMFYRNQISTIHDITYVRYPESFNWKFKAAYKIIVPLMAASSRRILTVSNFSKQEITSYFKIPSNKIEVIYNAPGNIFVRPSKGISEPEEKYLLAVSSPNVHKNFSALVNAFKTSSASGFYKLMIVGKQESQVFKTSETHDDGNIIYTGDVSDEKLVQIYQSASGFLFPSLYEGFGIPPIEAQACGIPVLASHQASLPEILGDSALYVDAFNISDIARGIDELVKPEISKQLIELGSVNSQRFSWRESANKVSSILDGVINEKKY